MRNTEKQFFSDFCIQFISTTFSNIQVWEEKLAFARRFITPFSNYHTLFCSLSDFKRSERERGDRRWGFWTDRHWRHTSPRRPQRLSFTQCRTFFISTCRRLRLRLRDRPNHPHAGDHLHCKSSIVTVVSRAVKVTSPMCLLAQIGLIKQTGTDRKDRETRFICCSPFQLQRDTEILNPFNIV